MINYLRLVHLEITRFRLILLSLLVLTFGLQAAGLIVKVNQELEDRSANSVYGISNGANASEGELSFEWAVDAASNWYLISIGLGIAALLCYMLLIWYREWFGRHTFVYRLLMLPGSRFRIYAAKLTALLLFVFAMVGFQMLMLPVEKGLFNLLVAPDLRVDTYLEDAIRANQLLNLLLPRSLEQFVYSYGLGIIGVTVVFAVILLERSFKWAGLIAGLVYGALCLLVLVLPLMDDSALYPFEYYLLELAACALVLLASVGLSGWLLAKKITV